MSHAAMAAPATMKPSAASVTALGGALQETRSFAAELALYGRGVAAGTRERG